PVTSTWHTDPIDHPTCANDRLDMEIYFAPTSNVTVQPYCDNAVHDVCTHISKTSYSPDEKSKTTIFTAIHSPTNSGSTEDGCQATLITRTPYYIIPYQTCVERFQLITVGCVLGAVVARAAEEQQAAALNVVDVEGGDFSRWGPTE
ncbi:MAG: hypothetical protein Q9180_007728, partial [Flavoplaca navasiana]